MGIEFSSLDVASSTCAQEQRDAGFALAGKTKVKKKEEKFLVGGRDREPHMKQGILCEG
jgi:hypothetical protein